MRFLEVLTKQAELLGKECSDLPPWGASVYYYCLRSGESKSPGLGSAPRSPKVHRLHGWSYRDKVIQYPDGKQSMFYRCLFSTLLAESNPS